MTTERVELLDFDTHLSRLLFVSKDVMVERVERIEDCLELLENVSHQRVLCDLEQVRVYLWPQFPAQHLCILHFQILKYRVNYFHLHQVDHVVFNVTGRCSRISHRFFLLVLSTKSAYITKVKELVTA